MPLSYSRLRVLRGYDRATCLLMIWAGESASAVLGARYHIIPTATACLNSTLAVQDSLGGRALSHQFTLQSRALHLHDRFPGTVSPRLSQTKVKTRRPPNPLLPPPPPPPPSTKAKSVGGDGNGRLSHRTRSTSESWHLRSEDPGAAIERRANDWATRVRRLCGERWQHHLAVRAECVRTCGQNANHDCHRCI